MSAPLALICSVALEGAPLRRRLSRVGEHRVGGRSVATGALGTTAAILVLGGMGKTNAAQSLTALLESRKVRGVMAFGVGGAYPGAGLGVGDVALASSEIYADEGVAAPDGWISTEQIGIPLASAAGADLFNEFPVDRELLAAATGALRDSGTPAVVGPFATVSCCSGTAARGREIADRFGAVCESMEGAACAHVAALYGVPFLEVRGISNLVEDRDLSRWRLAEAAEAAAEAVAAIVTVGKII